LGGEQVREHRRHHKDGSLWAVGSLLGDQPHGPWQWFRGDGTKLRPGTFERGVQVGAWTPYDRASESDKVTRIGRRNTARA
jgi:hypothetical protein